MEILALCFHAVVVGHYSEVFVVLSYRIAGTRVTPLTNWTGHSKPYGDGAVDRNHNTQ